ncbi:hypothetical protein BX616_002765 [Lobosporangium transversale]|nr:hypothetical protein BX616_002765 [Lobosporangium transversale]
MSEVHLTRDRKWYLDARHAILEQQQAIARREVQADESVEILQEMMKDWERKIRNFLHYESRLQSIQEAIDVFDSSQMPPTVVEIQGALRIAKARGASGTIASRREMLQYCTILVWDLIFLRAECRRKVECLQKDLQTLEATQRR